MRGNLVSEDIPVFIPAASLAADGLQAVSVEDPEISIEPEPHTVFEFEGGKMLFRWEWGSVGWVAPPESCSASEIAINLMDYISVLYELENPERIFEFLLYNPNLAKILFSAFGKIKYFFGAETKLRLKYIEGIEFESHGYLKVGIVSDLVVEEFLSHLNDFDEGWWLDEVPNSDGKLVFNLAR